MLTTYIEAEYESGFVLREDEQDHSPYDAGANIFNAILHGRPCSAHGPMTRFSLITPETAHHIDWTEVPENARPIRVKAMKRDFDGAGQPKEDPQELGILFGYQWTETYVDENGVERERNMQDTIIIGNEPEGAMDALNSVPQAISSAPLAIEGT